MNKKTLTVFTPTYNRAHTIGRTYESLCRQTCQDFEWLVIDDGSTDNTKELIQSFIDECKIPIRYIYKENGGLYTGYNIAYANIDTVLNVCIDSDDYMPDNAVELILRTWRQKGSEKYAGILGLDFYSDTKEPIGGYFNFKKEECFLSEVINKRLHVGDAKQVLRTDLMKQISPQIGYPGEKNFNPIYMTIQVCDVYPLLVLNENICFVEYQENDSMSKGIYFQYVNSPRSFAKMRILDMQLRHNTFFNKVRSAVHYIAEMKLANDKEWLKKSPLKILTLSVYPLGFLLYKYIKAKTQ